MTVSVAHCRYCLARQLLRCIDPHECGELNSATVRGVKYGGCRAIVEDQRVIVLSLTHSLSLSLTLSLSLSLTLSVCLCVCDSVCDCDCVYVCVCVCLSLTVLVISDDVVKEAMGLDHVTRWEDVLSLVSH